MTAEGRWRFYREIDHVFADFAGSCYPEGDLDEFDTKDQSRSVCQLNKVNDCVTLVHGRWLGRNVYRRERINPAHADEIL